MTEDTQTRALKEKGVQELISVKDRPIYTRSISTSAVTERRALRNKAFQSCAVKLTTTWKQEIEEDALGDDIEQQEVSQLRMDCEFT